MSEKPERLDIRLTEDEKNALAELAKQRGVSMTDLVRTWIMRGDIVNVLAEQLFDFVKDFEKWQFSENRNSSIYILCETVQNRLGFVEDVSKRKILNDWIFFFRQNFQFLKANVSVLKERFEVIVKEMKGGSEIKKAFLINGISNLATYIISYDNMFVKGFMDILQHLEERTKKNIGKIYNDEFRTRYNEIASKYEDFLKRAQRELGEELEKPMPRAKEFQSED